jgi:hypothetical protein
VPAVQSPTVRRRRLGQELRQLRDAAGLTIEEVAQRLEVSPAKISRIETSRVSVHETSRTYWINMEYRGRIGQSPHIDPGSTSAVVAFLQRRAVRENRGLGRTRN